MAAILATMMLRPIPATATSREYCINSPKKRAATNKKNNSKATKKSKTTNKKDEKATKKTSKNYERDSIEVLSLVEYPVTLRIAFLEISCYEDCQ